MKTFLTIAFVLVSSMVGAATWVSNPDHSEILFQVPYMEVSEVTGRFKEFRAQVQFKDDGSLEGPVTVSIATASIDTGNGMRDNHLRGHDFFRSQAHPEIFFKSKKITKLSGNNYLAEGDLHIRGITKPATVAFSVSDARKDTWGFQNRFVKFKSSLKRKDYNMTWNKTLEGQQFLVGDVVNFWGTFQMQPANSKTPNSKHMIPDSEYIRQRDLERQKKEESSFVKKIRNLINGQ